MMRVWIFLAGLNGLMAIAMGAYAAHGLAGDMTAQHWATQASTYQLFHALALLAADRLTAEVRRGNLLAHGAALLFFAGIVLFCGSLYLRAFGISVPLAMITPAGGITLMAGWAVLTLSAFRK